jgi:hypothetical protein
MSYLSNLCNKSNTALSNVEERLGKVCLDIRESLVTHEAQPLCPKSILVDFLVQRWRLDPRKIVAAMPKSVEDNTEDALTTQKARSAVLRLM